MERILGRLARVQTMCWEATHLVCPALYPRQRCIDHLPFAALFALADTSLAALTTLADTAEGRALRTELFLFWPMLTYYPDRAALFQYMKEHVFDFIDLLRLTYWFWQVQIHGHWLTSTSTDTFPYYANEMQDMTRWLWHLEGLYQMVHEEMATKKIPFHPFILNLFISKDKS